MMDLAQFVYEVLARENEWIDAQCRALQVGETFCLHENRHPDALYSELSGHVVESGLICDIRIAKTQYGPMTAGIQSLINAPVAGR